MTWRDIGFMSLGNIIGCAMTQFYEAHNWFGLFG